MDGPILSVLVVLNTARTAVEASRLTHASVASVRKARGVQENPPCDMMTSQSADDTLLADDTLDTLAAVHGSEDLFWT